MGEDEEKGVHDETIVVYRCTIIRPATVLYRVYTEYTLPYCTQYSTYSVLH